MRQSISFNDELRYISRLNNSNKSHYSPKTAGMKQRTSMNESMGQESNRSNHENFYKRVQEILRKWINSYRNSRLCWYLNYKELGFIIIIYIKD